MECASKDTNALFFVAIEQQGDTGAFRTGADHGAVELSVSVVDESFDRSVIGRK